MKKILNNKNVIVASGMILFITMFLMLFSISCASVHNKCYEKGGKPIIRYTLGIPVETYCELPSE